MASAEDKKLLEREERIGGPAGQEVNVPKETLDFFGGDEIRARVFYEKYALKDEQGRHLEKLPEEMWRRIAKALSSVEATEEKRSEWHDKFLWLLQDWRFVPGGRIMFGAGSIKKATLLNCLRGDTPVLVRKSSEITTPILGYNNSVMLQATELVQTVENIRIKDLVGQKVEVLTPAGWSKVVFQSFGHQRLYKIRLKNGDELFATANHEWVIRSNKRLIKKTTKELMVYKGETGLVVNLPRKPEKDSKYYEGVVHGIVYGDGSKSSAKYSKTYYVWLFGVQRELAKYLPHVHEYGGKQRAFRGALLGSGIRSIYDLKKIPPSSETSSYWYGFISGYLATDGWMDTCGVSAGIDSHNKEDLETIKAHLGRVGFLGNKVFVSRTHSPYSGDSSPLYRLGFWKASLTEDLFLRSDHLVKFRKSTGGKKWHTIGIDCIEETDIEEEVYCCDEPLTHTFVLGNGVLTGNCYVIPIREDSIEAIFEWCKEAARTYSLGGGVGGDISVLRPRGAPVNNTAIVSSGAVSFMEMMSETTHTIGQNGRRGALMITIRVDHPDIMEFIKVKQNLGKVRYANISVRISDEFMRAVESDGDFTLRFESEKVSKMERKVKARQVWGELISSARDWAEPGLLFWDTVKRFSPSEYNGMEVVTTNPCVIGETPVLTPDGWKSVDSLKAGDEIVTAYGTAKPITEIYTHEDQDVYKVVFTDGGEVTATKGHIFHSRQGRADKDRYWSKFWDRETRLSDLRSGDMVRVPRNVWAPNNPIETHGVPDREYGFMLGVLLGDGCYTPKIVARGHAKIASDYREKEWNEKIINTFRHYASDNISVTNSSGDNGCYILLQKQGTQFILNKTLLAPSKSFEKRIPLEYINSNLEVHRGIIDGLMSTDGNINMDPTNPAMRISSTSRGLLQDIKLVLAFHGIHAKIYKTKHVSHAFGNRTIESRHESAALYVYGNDIAKFAATFPISHPEKRKRLEKLRDMSVGASSDFSKIKSIEYAGKATVYDLYEKETDTWITNGYVSRGCSEQPLQPYGACDLGAINLPVFVLDPFTDNARIDWASLEKTVRYSMRFLDNVLDYNADKHPLREQAEAVGKSRRTGLGVTGLADMFVKLRIKYDSEEAIALADKLFEMIKNAAYDESTEIAKEKGPFPLFDKKKHLSMSFVRTLGATLMQKIEENGLRNVALLTLAPVGSGSVLVGGSSGVEPIFAFSYTRRSESLSKEFFKVYHPLVLEYMRIAGLKDEAKLPEFFVASHQIKPEFRVKMQGTIQKHIDSAISSTVNLPESTTVEQVGDIYMMAWKAGCKGITVYREGSREGILISEEEEKKKGTRISDAEVAWKRPQAMVGKTIKLKLQQASLYVTVDFDESGKIKEVFVNMGHTGSQEKSYTEAIGRMISRYLQLNGDVESVIESLKGIKASDSIAWDRGIKLYSVPDAIAKALEIAMGKTSFKASPLGGEERTVEDLSDGYQTHVKQSGKGVVKADVCPECSEKMLVYESGCYTCKNCGYTKCA